jgi:hypothetical protein
MKLEGEYIDLKMRCDMALRMTPKWSPYRLLWKFGIWYAERKINGLRR